MLVSGGTERRRSSTNKIHSCTLPFSPTDWLSSMMKISGADYEKINMEGRIPEPLITTVKGCFPVLLSSFT